MQGMAEELEVWEGIAHPFVDTAPQNEKRCLETATAL